MVGNEKDAVFCVFFVFLSGFDFSALESCKSLTEGSGGQHALLLILALKHRKKLAEELALHRHITLKALCVIKRHSLVLHSEGIETEEHKNVVIDAGCDMLQGYYFYRPMPVSKFEPLLDNKKED